MLSKIDQEERDRDRERRTGEWGERFDNQV